MKLKYCGLKTESALHFCNDVKIDYAGFILYRPSSRFISFEDLEKLLQKIQKKTYKTVMVSVNHPVEQLTWWAKKLKIDALQLHGDEDEKYLKAVCKNLEKNHNPTDHAPMIKIFKVLRLKRETSKNEVAEMLKTYSDYTNTFLIEPHHKDYGGAGKSLEQKCIADVLQTADKLEKKIFLSGGITKDDMGKIKKLSEHQSLFAIDVSSAIESEKGVKDLKKMQDFYSCFAKTFHGDDGT